DDPQKARPVEPDEAERHPAWGGPDAARPDKGQGRERLPEDVMRGELPGEPAGEEARAPDEPEALRGVDRGDGGEREEATEGDDGEEQPGEEERGGHGPSVPQRTPEGEPGVTGSCAGARR